MPHRLPLLILTGCLALLFSFPIAAQDIIKLDHSRITAEALTQRIGQLINSAKVTGLSVSIFNDDEPVYTTAFGYARLDKGQKMDTSTVFWACSFSKAVFAYSVVKLAESNIHLDTPLVHYLPNPLPDYVFTKKTRERTSPHTAESMYCTIGDMSVYGQQCCSRKDSLKKVLRRCPDHRSPFFPNRSLVPMRGSMTRI